MRFSQTFPLLLATQVGAIGRATLVSTISGTISKANLPGTLAVAVEKSREIVTETLPRATAQSAKWVAANPGTAAACGVMGAGAVLLTAPAVVIGPGLGLVGFGANGVVAGSSAAAMQSTIGSVVSPSLFATFQSAAAGGYGVATVYPVVQAVGGTLASSALAGVTWVKSKSQ